MLSLPHWRFIKRFVLTLLVMLTLCELSSAYGVTVTERETLSAIVRQLALLDRLAEQAQRTAPIEHTRYHFDYRRLREDMQRLRIGINDYLAPPRAQPRDPIPLIGDYRRNHESKEPSR